MIHTNETHPDENLDEVALDVFQDAISPNWLLQLLKVTGIALVVLIAVAVIF